MPCRPAVSSGEKALPAGRHLGHRVEPGDSAGEVLAERPAKVGAGEGDHRRRVGGALWTVDHAPAPTAVDGPVGGRTDLRDPMLGVEEVEAAVRALTGARELALPMRGAVKSLEDPEGAAG